MELWQAFLLGMMVAWTPGLIVLAVLLREIKTARVHHASRAAVTSPLGARAAAGNAGDRVARRPYRFRNETSQAQLTNVPRRRSKRLQAQT
jgi:hypothetical protein